ncbi:MAG: hypothetical protein K8823_1234 [Cenarchaeum symbiont of Oopsacas minuta]|nr:hypothetical protein [Cenarchaeum symbiont of Oopsacas minuta]
MDKSDYFDHIILEILNTLHQSSGLRYSNLKTKLNVSDTSLVNRLNKLKLADYIIPQVTINEFGKNNVVYVLTKNGDKLVDKLNIKELIQNVESQLAD